jgi:hypothetical protein
MGDKWLGEVGQAQAPGRGGSAWGQPAMSPSRWRSPESERNRAPHEKIARTGTVENLTISPALRVAALIPLWERKGGLTLAGVLDEHRPAQGTFTCRRLHHTCVW